MPDKKKFGQTGFGQFLKKAVSALPDIAVTAMDIVDNPANAIRLLKGQLQQKSTNDPVANQLLLELQMAEMDFELELAALDQKDRENARELQKEALQSDSWPAQHFLYLLSTFMVIGAFAFGIGLMFIEVPEANKRLVEMFADVIVFGGTIMVYQFFLGGSLKNKNKQNSE